MNGKLAIQGMETTKTAKRKSRILTGPRMCAELMAGLLLAGVLPAGNASVELTREHVDLQMLYRPEHAELLTLNIHDNDAEVTYGPDEVILVVAEEARFELPPGTPFGEAGDPIWILPQSQNANLLYLGTDSEGIPHGVFSGPLTLQLRSLQGPGDFHLWQADAVGGFVVRMNTTDGITEEDRIHPAPGSHEHFNWGFSAPGVYRLTFQLSGRRLGESTDIRSADTTFTFHVLPLPDLTPFELWQESYWPDGAPDEIQGPGADPDVDGIVNAMEYALGLDPLTPGAEGLPEFATVVHEGRTFGALRFNRVKSATDIEYDVVAADGPDGPWQSLFEIAEINDQGELEQVTVRDDRPIEDAHARYYRLLVRFITP